MAGLWYALLAVMLTVYVVLDGFDFGAGIVHLQVARDERERRLVLAAIGPVWDGNEVWLVASGGVLVFAFPRAYAAAFSGFYLPLMLVLWLLVLRGLAIELRGQWEEPLWHAFFDVLFAFSSTVLALVLGASFGNVVRGVPIGGDAAFAAPLFGPGGALDLYTVLVGVFAVLVLGAHGAAYLAWKCEGALYARSRRLVARTLPVVAVALVFVTLATWRVQPPLLARFARRPWAWPLPACAIAALVVAWLANRRGRDRAAFLATSGFLASLLVATALSLYPVIL
ncbi:MAG TPA: cytochrome d ubiquinol oxidase subunit II, partial [Ideonella sp.]|nr:cytochrome d ubiquinol oxidase subunit II [Ideonella sp.]